MKKLTIIPFLFLFFVSLAWCQERREPPVWKVGYEWQYAFHELGRRVFVTHRVVDVTENFYLVAMGGIKGLHAYDKKTLNIKYYIDEYDKWQKYDDSLRRLLDFPMFVGKSWADEIVKTQGYTNLKIKISNNFKVEEFEKVNNYLPLERFNIFRIFCQESATLGEESVTRWIRYWYSPEAKNVVRQQIGISSSYSDYKEIDIRYYKLENP